MTKWSSPSPSPSPFVPPRDRASPRNRLAPRASPRGSPGGLAWRGMPWRRVTRIRAPPKPPARVEVQLLDPHPTASFFASISVSILNGFLMEFGSILESFFDDFPLIFASLCRDCFSCFFFFFFPPSARFPGGQTLFFCKHSIYNRCFCTFTHNHRFTNLCFLDGFGRCF